MKKYAFWAHNQKFFQGYKLSVTLPETKGRTWKMDAWKTRLVSFWLKRPIFRGGFRGKCSFREGHFFVVKFTPVSWLDEIYWDSLDDEGLKCQMGRYDGGSWG